MKYLDLASIVCFLLAGTANNDCIGGAMLFVALSGICAVLAMKLPHHKRKRAHRK